MAADTANGIRHERQADVLLLDLMVCERGVLIEKLLDGRFPNTTRDTTAYGKYDGTKAQRMVRGYRRR